ncbi:hypothetical protein C360_03005 [Cryptococcus neoformans Bt15]|nr:hypothetical protein C360_03005 [Cryptococcus neoformans var. grubii Bt15]
MIDEYISQGAHFGYHWIFYKQTTWQTSDGGTIPPSSTSLLRGNELDQRIQEQGSIIKMVHRQPAVLTHATFYPFQGPEPLIQASSVFPSPARSYIMLPELTTPKAKRTPRRIASTLPLFFSV